MFDLYFLKDFSGKNRHKKDKTLFSGYSVYDHIPKVEYKNSSETSSYCFLERDKNEYNHFVSDKYQIFLYGSVFTNNDFAGKTAALPQKVSVKELDSLLSEYGDRITEYLKGSFVLVIEYFKTREVVVISDSLNVLPLYYSYRDNILQISSNTRLLLDSGFCSDGLDEKALLEQVIFDYMPGDHYFYKDIRKIENGMKYSFSSKKVEKEQYWSIDEFYHSELFKKKESLDMLAEQLRSNVQLYTSDTKNILVSLTGGFDGRTNIAMLDKAKSDFLTYSYGKPGSKQIEVPKNISDHSGFNYQPVYLDKEFEDNYSLYSERAIQFSNGTAPIHRANYPFAYERLIKYSSTILTGLFGSEILRPIHRGLGIFTNYYVEELLLNDDFERAKQFVLKKISEKNILDKRIIKDHFDDAVEIIRGYRDKYGSLGKQYPYFFFYLQEGIRKYFMQEIQIERPYVTTRFPYYDLDLLKLIFKTPFAGIYNGFLKKSKIKRRRGQLLYAHIINKFSKDLGEFKLDRGYTPNDLLKPFPLNYLFIAGGVMEARKYIRRRGNDTFDDSGNWERDTIEIILKNCSFAPGFDRSIHDNFRSGKYLSDPLRFYHLISMIRFTGGK